jgi:hypothetical protein
MKRDRLPRSAAQVDSFTRPAPEITASGHMFGAQGDVH